MTFRRTPSALLSYHRFLAVDLVVFCEGGQSLTYQEALNDGSTDGTLDTLYWSAVADMLGPWQKSFHFKSVGSKTVLKQIADEVFERDIKTVSVCRDQDYDGILNRKHACDRVAYTYGYSWENDVLDMKVLENLFTDIAGSGPRQQQILQDINLELTRFSRQIIRWIEIDVALHASSRGSIFDRRKPLFCIDLGKPPRLRDGALESRLVELGFTRGPRRVCKLRVEESLKICFGKTISNAIFHCFLAHIRKIVKGLRIDYDFFMRLATAETIRCAKAGFLPQYTKHINDQATVFA